MCCFLLVSSSKKADNFVFLKLIYFIKIMNLKDGQLLLLNNPYPCYDVTLA